MLAFGKQIAKNLRAAWPTPEPVSGQHKPELPGPELELALGRQVETRKDGQKFKTALSTYQIPGQTELWEALP